MRKQELKEIYRNIELCISEIDESIKKAEINQEIINDFSMLKRRFKEEENTRENIIQLGFYCYLMLLELEDESVIVSVKRLDNYITNNLKK
jgi:seryl-tRNA synthetase